ncbi:C-terminal binding protein [Olsenella sp. HMSC062G07]|uniref:C-terminal binding protein n=1 Tax=Olsenella sp. HMSC062G07 TaxID=1739330 RepID=UPI0008A55707|nr:C-terminal binding protein [Olsenella sp. HMSC062G07]OFK23513.1 hypothetical protein HMPREF2826_04355 [Olsenella sp. HMSC062G07]
MAHRILLYTVDGNARRAESYLASRGLADAFDVTGLAHAPFTCPTADELAGQEAVLGELMPVSGDDVKLVADAGVRLVVSMSVGINHVDVGGLRERGVLVANCPGYCAQDVALHALSLMLDLMRQTTFLNRGVLAGGWDPHHGYAMHRTQGQTLGLVYFGNIARQMVPLAKALGMRVLAWAPTKDEACLAAAGCEKATTLDELLADADVVSLHCPLIPQTRGLIGARELSLMKPTALLVNTARGAVIDEDALVAALDAGQIRAAGLDVLANETCRDRRLIDHPRCLVTPHAAFVSEEALDTLTSMALDAVIDVLVHGRAPKHEVRP